MAKLQDVIAYFLKKYPDFLAHEMSNARLTKMVYLANWHQVLKHRRQITDINWYFDNFGPFVHDVERTASEMPDLFVVNLGSNAMGQAKKTFSLRRKDYVPDLTEQERESLDYIIENTQELYWAPFINLVYSTHPIASSQRYTYLNLVEKADEYQMKKK